MIRIGRVLQRHWDWRAACNFVFGGSGGALLALATVHGAGDAAALATRLLALVLVGAGLACVWLEIGRPWRAMNVFRHPQRSWMTREAIVATATFALALSGLAFGVPVLSWAAAAGGIAFVYCQGRILKATRGVPAWRQAAIVPLVVATGFAEAGGLMTALLAVLAAVPGWLPWLLLASLAARALAWKRYRSELKADDAPEPALVLAGRLEPVVVVLGTLLPAALIVPALAAAALPATAPAAPALQGVAGLLALLPGWTLKFVLVTRAAQLQGYAFGKLRRGHPLARARG
ncbi:MAG: dimethyl sulfoxide reductase anchor subunit [Burkholderiales bacterium]|nr:dimethyl sulfoxide reductase anchor subunit [Burkholderiales bacterium]